MSSHTSIYCSFCQQQQPRDDFTEAQIKKYSGPRGVIPKDSKIKCRRHGGTELKCDGPCGKFRPRDSFTKNRRQTGNETWCRDCLIWQLSDEGGHVPFVAKDNYRNPDEIPDRVDTEDLGAENVFSRGDGVITQDPFARVPGLASQGSGLQTSTVPHNPSSGTNPQATPVTGSHPGGSSHPGARPTQFNLPMAFDLGAVRADHGYSDDESDDGYEGMTLGDRQSAIAIEDQLQGLQLGQNGGMARNGQGHSSAQAGPLSVSEENSTSNAPHHYLPDMFSYKNTSHNPTSAPTMQNSASRAPAPGANRGQPKPTVNYNQIGPNGQVVNRQHAPTVGSTTTSALSERGQPLRNVSNGSSQVPRAGSRMVHGSATSQPSRPSTGPSRISQPSTGYSTTTNTSTGGKWAKPAGRKTEKAVAPEYIDRKKWGVAGDDFDDSDDEC